MGPETETEPYWIFGYGSLIWKHPPSFARRVPCYIKGGYIRRFWQISELAGVNADVILTTPQRTVCFWHSLDAHPSSSKDHRGTPEAPGRVVTLVKSETDEPLWGAAYLIAPDEVDAIKSYLDIREINGYTSSTIELYHSYTVPPAEFTSADATGVIAAVDPTLPNPIKAHVYIGTPDNPQYVGPPKSTLELARHILHSKGPSGENKEYLYNLRDALAELAPGAHDDHVSELADMVKELEKQNLVDSTKTS